MTSEPVPGDAAPPPPPPASNATGATGGLDLLLRAGDLFASSLDYRETLQHVARLCVPALGDLCMVDIAEDGRLMRLANAHVRPDKGFLVQQLARLHPAIDGSPAPAGRVFATGEAELLSEVTPDIVASHTADPEHARLIREIGMRSHLAVPMHARGAIVGVLSVGITESDRRFGADDLALAREVARRAAIAVDNARLYASAQRELALRGKAEVALRRSERHFRAIMEQSPLSMQRLAPDGTTIGVNATWRALWGIAPEDLAGYSVLRDPQLEAAGITPLLRRAFAGEAVALPTIPYDPEQTLPGRVAGAGVRWVRAYAYPIRDEAGEIEEVVLLHQDVTEERRADERVRASEERLQRALSIGGMNVWDWDLATDIVTTSENGREFWGIDIGTAADFLAVLDPADVAMTQVLASESIASGEPYEMTYRLRAAGKPLRWVTSRGRVQYDASGTPVRILGTTIDVTARKRAEDTARMLADAGERLGRSLDYEATLAELAEVVVPTLADWFAVDLLGADGELERVSVHHPDPAKIALAHALQQRYPPRRDQPGNPWELLASGQGDWAATIPEEALLAGAEDAEHADMLRALQLNSYIRVPLMGRDGAIGLLTLVFAESGRHYVAEDVALANDLARRAAAAVDHARLFAQLALADRRKDEFLAMLAHELRNPLAPINTAAQLLRMAPRDGAHVDEASQVITRQVAHMTELVDDLLDVSRVTRGLIQLDRDVVDIGTIVAAAVEQVQSLVQAKGHALAVRTGAGPHTVLGDRARLVQVLVNLLNNAAKYTPPGGRVELEISRAGPDVRVVVTDTGAGIEAALLPEVFELFTQGQRTPDRAQGGLGIGLALVSRLVQLHGGKVWASSAGVDRGSTFTLLLPYVDAPAAAPAVSAPARAPAARRRLLVTDDNVDAAEVLATVLRLEGHEVHVAFDGAQALAVAARAPLDLCFLDIGLPDMTGHALARALRASLGDACPVLVALTGYGQPDDREQSSAAGFDHHLVKPAEVTQVLSLLAALR